ncbi:MAG: extracellular solute-binding protein [Chloroflexota bacterium]|nr:extracellular solute-binding protein [Chloroflexota bacterium]MDE2854013.1 extracellular solute-binding protein [Chloroflexota bacterium]MDE2948999.1 extracellular solute-binding protein [Chloroflexota bacterium]
MLNPSRFLLLVLLTVAIMAPVSAQDFSGQTVVVVTQTGSAIGGPVLDKGPIWEEATGGNIELQTFAFGELFEKIVTALSTGSGDYDVLIYAADWAGDIMAPGYVMEIPQETLDAIEADDVIPLYADRITTWGGVPYALPYDGDAHMLYYRKDLVDNEMYGAEFEAEYGYALGEPTTWSQYRDIAEFFNGKEVDTAGSMAPVYGALEAQRRNAQSYWVYLSRAAGYGKVPGNPCFFFSCDDMTPQVNNPGWVRALEEYIDIRSVGDPEMINYDVADTRTLMATGTAVLNLDWGDVGTISVDENVSLVKGAVGFGVLPGGDAYWDYEAGEWVMEENPAPFIAFGGWIISVAADSDVTEAALDFASFLASKDVVNELAVTGGTGINPSRFSQLADTAPWVAAGFDEESAADYLDAIQNTINHPNAVLDIRITGSAEYLSTLDAEIARALAGEISAQEALDNVAELWDAITDRLGRDAQAEQYRAAVGYMGDM